jgi:hypothetical protein
MDIQFFNGGCLNDIVKFAGYKAFDSWSIRLKPTFLHNDTYRFVICFNAVTKRHSSQALVMLLERTWTGALFDFESTLFV